jgi:uncharacterized ACR, COG1430
MKKVIVLIGDKSYRCDLTENEEERKKGLSNKDFLAPDEGMLFDFNKSDKNPQMWMKDTTLKLDMIGIDSDGKVCQIETPEPESERLISFPQCKYILEVNTNSEISLYDDFEISEDDLEDFVMKVLAPDGSSQFLLKGGERIFSRISTKSIIIKAKKAFKNKNNPEQYIKDCRKLGKYIFRELHAQDTRDPQYVDLPENKNNS